MTISFYSLFNACYNKNPCADSPVYPAFSICIELGEKNEDCMKLPKNACRRNVGAILTGKR